VPHTEALQVRRQARPVTLGQPQTVKVPGTCTREAGLDRALVKDSVGTYRKDGQDRALPSSVATACSNHPGQSRSAAGQRSDNSHVNALSRTHWPDLLSSGSWAAHLYRLRLASAGPQPGYSAGRRELAERECVN
jgi:hypothetical protein